MRSNIYLGLVHFPVYNKNKEIVATSVTNFDIHDISRICRTYDIKEYQIIVPVEAQKKLTERIINYWKEGFGSSYNKDRIEAFSSTCIVESIELSVRKITTNESKKPFVITTSANFYENSVNYSEMSKIIFSTDKPILLLFGTGWGLTEETMKLSDYILHPIRGSATYNHLSVRSAISIILDRLLGEN